MGKQVGITHDPEQRKKSWESERPGLTGWKIVESGLTHKEAQAIEDDYVDNKKGYNGHAGGEKIPGKKYSVYTFNY